jgi:hypothetical protein
MVGSKLRQATTDLAKQLAGLLAIVEVEELRGCGAVGATTTSRQGVGTASANRGQRPTMLAQILSAQLPPVQGRRSCRGGGRLGEGSAGIDVEIAIVRMLLPEVITRLRLGVTSGENLVQLLDKLLQLLAGKFPTKPKYQSWYAAHGGESLGNLAGSLTGGFGKRDFTAFFTRRQVPPQDFQPQCGKASWLTNRHGLATGAGGETKNASFSPEFNKIAA